MNSKKGITLIELIVALTLLGMVTIAIISIIHLTLRSNETTTNQVNLTNEANLILSSIENEFYKNNSDPEFKLEDHILQMYSGNTWKALHDDRIFVKRMKKNGQLIIKNATDDSEQYSKSTNNDLLSIEITVAATSDPEKELTFETTFKRY